MESQKVNYHFVLAILGRYQLSDSKISRNLAHIETYSLTDNRRVTSYVTPYEGRALSSTPFPHSVQVRITDPLTDFLFQLDVTF